MIILLMGVAGAGKTTVGKLLAGTLGWRFEDADSYHSAHNIAKMQAGIPLTDEDRKPWLDKLHEAIGLWRNDNVVLACSALKKSYRDLLISGPDVKLVYLSGTYALILQRLVARHGHYAHAACSAANSERSNLRMALWSSTFQPRPRPLSSKSENG